MSGIETDLKPAVMEETFEDESQVKREITKNIVIFGETGAGKSSIINLLTRQNSAIVGTGARATTRFPSHYTIYGEREDEAYNLFDTGGFSEGDKGILAYKDAKAALEMLINQLSTPNDTGVGLLVFVLRDGRALTESAVQCYQDFKEYCANKVPILLVMTHFDFTADPDSEISKKMGNFHDKNMRFDSTIAGCAADANKHKGEQKEFLLKRRDTTRRQILQQFKIHTGRDGWKKPREITILVESRQSEPARFWNIGYWIRKYVN